MKNILCFATCLALVFSIFCSAFAEELKPIQLPKPQVDGGRPLMQVLKHRGSSRSFSSEKLPLQVLSNLPSYAESHACVLKRTTACKHGSLDRG